MKLIFNLNYIAASGKSHFQMIKKISWAMSELGWDTVCSWSLSETMDRTGYANDCRWIFNGIRSSYC